jgi:hypothetical protein
MMKPSKDCVRATTDAVRRIFLNVDPAGMRSESEPFPDSEYDAVVDRAVSRLLQGVPPQEIAADAVRHLESDWGIEVQPGKGTQLARRLASLT